MSKIKSFFAVAFLLMLVPGATALAQTSKGFIVGNVLDPGGATITGASVKITNVATGVTRDTVSQSDGNYRFDAIDPGTYRIEVTASGFKTTTREGIVAAAAQTVEVAVQLEVGATSETVNVTADTSVILQTQDGARINTFDTTQITQLPIAGLNPVNLVFTLPGVVDPGPRAGGFVQGTEFSVNGLRPRSNNQLLDGLDNNDNSIAGQFYQPVLRDGYSEVAVLQSDYSAEFGRAGGAVVNVVTRSGTNQFHGSVYDVIRNNRLNTLTPGEKRNGLTRVPQFKENTFGFSIGGPVIQNKLFFFGTFQPDFTRSSTVATGIVPTEAGFNQLRSLFPVGTNPNLDRFLSIVGSNRGTVSPFTVSAGTGRPAIEFATAQTAASQPVDDYQGYGRVDYSPNERDNFAARYLFEKQTSANQFPTIFQGFQIDVPSFVQNAYLSYTRVLSPQTTNELRFGFGRFNAFFTPTDPAASTGGPVFSFSGTGLGRGISSVGLAAGFPQGRIFNNFQIQDTITRTFGNNTIRAGGDVNIQRSKQLIPINTRGTLTFSSGGGFNALANFLDQRSGSGGSANISIGSPVNYPNAFYQNYFVNDTYRIRPNLTLNLGLRYENYGTPFNTVSFPAFPGLNQPFNTVARQKRDTNNFAPRVSFAYQPKFGGGLGGLLLGSERTVIRGGFAVNYDFFFNNILLNTAASSPNTFTAQNLGSTVGGRGLSNFGASSLPASGTANPLSPTTSIDPNLRNPETYVFNFGVQRQLPFKLIGDVAYVGSRGTRLFINEQINPGVTPFGTSLSRLSRNRGSVTLRTNGGDSVYHSLQARLERGLSNGLLFRFAYTFSKAIDDVNSEVFATTGGSSLGSQPFNRRLDRSVASFDVPHRFVVSAVYDLPSPAKSGVLKQIFGGFQLSGIYSIQSGAVESPFIGGVDLNNDGSSFNDRPAIANPNAPIGSVAFSNDFCDVPSATGFCTNDFATPITLNNARFVVDPTIRTGLAGRNVLRGPRQSGLDMSLTKSFRIPFKSDYGSTLEFRADFFNVLNHPNFAPGTGDVTDSTFNDPFSFGEGTRRSGRIQVRYSF